MTAPERLSLAIQTSGNINYITWRNGHYDGDIYQYAINLATNNTSEDTGYQYTFNMFNTQPHAHPGSDYQLVAMINGGFFQRNENPTYPVGYEKSCGSSVFYDTIIGAGKDDYQAFVIKAADHQQMVIDNHETLYWGSGYAGCSGGANSNASSGEPGALSSAIHSFIGYCDDVAFMGWNSSAMTGANLITSLKSIFGNDLKVIILDGGGSTQMWLRGSTVRPSSDSSGYRLIKNAICIYEHVGITPPLPTDPDRSKDQIQVHLGAQVMCYRQKDTSSYNIGYLNPTSYYDVIAKDGNWYQLADWAWINSTDVTYIPHAETRTITTIVSPEGGGTVTGGGSYLEGTEITLTATPATHYVFNRWSDGVNNPTRTITVTQDATYTAEFTILAQVTISASCTHGTTTGSGVYYRGDPVTVTCYPDEGYEFTQWSDLSTDNPHTFTANTNYEIAAFTQAEATRYTLTLESAGGVCTGAGSYPENSAVTISLDQFYNHKFTNWTGDITLTTNPAVVTMTQDISLIANTSNLDTNGGKGFLE